MKLKSTTENIFRTLKYIYKVHQQQDIDLYDVDMFIYDIAKYPWKDQYEFDSETQVNFNNAVMLFIHKDHTKYKHFGIEGQCIIFWEVTEWSKNAFDPPEGFDFDGIWITNPHYEETGRFMFDSEYESAKHYGFPANHHELWQKTEDKKEVL